MQDETKFCRNTDVFQKIWHSIARNFSPRRRSLNESAFPTTCTPYGVNSHRLLVRGVRTEYEPEAAEQVRQEEQESADTSSRWMWEYEKSLAAGVGLVALLRAVLEIVRKWRGRRENR